MNGTFVVYSAAGPHRDRARGTREQAYWDQHAEFIDGLMAAGFICMGGPLPDEHGAMMIVRAENEAEVRERLRGDPWYKQGILRLESVKRWEIFIDER
jgi:uncharacterized protein YciI